METSDLVLLWGGSLLVRLPVLLALLVGLILCWIAYLNRGRRTAYLLGTVSFGVLFVLALLGSLTSALPALLYDRGWKTAAIGTLLIVISVASGLLEAAGFGLLIAALWLRDRSQRGTP
jgi:hypothetical protein